MTDLINDVEKYYSDKISQYGATPQGVDWNGEESQVLRFNQLCQLILAEDYFSVNDLGCGYGAFLSFLDSRYNNFKYYGYDVSEAMIAAAKNQHKLNPRARFMQKSVPELKADFSVASGIFNVRLQHNDAEWLSYIVVTLDSLNEYSKRGFAFNCLTSYSDQDKRRDYLYYADPCWLFDLCKRKYSRNVVLYHDYGLYEFTIVVR